MSKAVLISIRPKWCELIASGEKTIEVRKTRPKLETPFKCYIYCTKPSFPHEDFFVFDAGTDKAKTFYGGGKVIGEFVCDKIDAYEYEYCTHPEIGMDYDCGDNWFCIDDADLEKACLTYKEFRDYAGNKDVYGWHISNLVIYDEPKRIFDFVRPACERVSDCGAGCSYWCGSLRRCMRNYTVLFPPQSWMYVEELT